MDDLSKARPLCDNMATFIEMNLDGFSSAEAAETFSEKSLDDMSSSELEIKMMKRQFEMEKMHQ